MGATACRRPGERPVEGWGLMVIGAAPGERATNEIFGVYGQALTDGIPSDGLVPVCRLGAAPGPFRIGDVST